MTDYDPIADAWMSVEYARQAIRERKASGGPRGRRKPVPDVKGLVRVLDDIDVVQCKCRVCEHFGKDSNFCRMSATTTRPNDTCAKFQLEASYKDAQRLLDVIGSII